jgi:L-iditol 2-dehydrogenase
MNDCRAAVITAHKQPLEIQRVPVPDPLEPGALLVKITASTLCGTDVPAAGRRHIADHYRT